MVVRADKTSRSEPLRLVVCIVFLVTGRCDNVFAIPGGSLYNPFVRHAQAEPIGK